MQTDDAELVRRTRRGDRHAFTQLVERYRNIVYGVAFHCLGRHKDAQDAAQDAFVQAYRRLDQLRDPHKFAPWLRRLTLNGCADLRRRQDRPGLPWYEVGHQAAPADDATERLTTRLAVREALDHLPERMRLAVVLYHLDGYSHEEAARFLGIPVNTVRGRLQSARRQLREEMREMMQEEINRGKPDADWTRRVVDEAMRRGDEALRSHERGDAARHFDAALAAAATWPTGAERRQATIGALLQKIQVIRYTGSAGEVSGLLEQALALAREGGDRHAQAEILSRLGDACASGAPERSVTYYESALEILRGLGDAPGRGHCLLALGLHLLQRDENAAGWGRVEQALGLFAEADCPDWIAVCGAMLNLLGEARGTGLSHLILWHAVCDVWQEQNGVVRFSGQPGFMVTHTDAAPRALYIGSVFWQISRLEVFLDARGRRGCADRRHVLLLQPPSPNDCHRSERFGLRHRARRDVRRLLADGAGDGSEWPPR